VKKSVLFKSMNIQTAFAFSGALFVCSFTVSVVQCFFTACARRQAVAFFYLVAKV